MGSTYAKDLKAGDRLSDGSTVIAVKQGPPLEVTIQEPPPEPRIYHLDPHHILLVDNRPRVKVKFA